MSDSKSIPDTPECVRNHLGLWCCEPGTLIRLHRALLDGKITAVSMEELESRRNAELTYEVNRAGIAVIPVTGVMQREESKFPDTCSTLRVRQLLRAASRDENVRGIMLVIDSPGGHVRGQLELVESLKSVRDRGVPVRAYVTDMACSAAYWLACGCDWISAGELAQIGNIGCFAVLYDYSEKYEREGVRVQVISTGNYKGIGTPGVPISDELVSEVRERVDLVNEKFISAVSSGRMIDLDRARVLADGKTYTPLPAQAAGLIDKIETFEAAMESFAAAIQNKMEEKMADEKTKLDEFQALADSCGYEFAKLNFGKSAEEIAAARQEQKIAELSIELEAQKTRVAELESENRTLRSENEKLKIPGARPVGFAENKSVPGESCGRRLVYNGKFGGK